METLSHNIQIGYLAMCLLAAHSLVIPIQENITTQRGEREMSRKIPFVTPVLLMKQPREGRRTIGQCKWSSKVVTHVATGEQGTQSFAK